MRKPTLSELKEAVFSVHMDSATSPNGFSSAFFFISCWNIISENMMSAAIDFFHRSSLPKAFNSSIMVIVPKVSNPERFSQIRKQSGRFTCRTGG